MRNFILTEEQYKKAVEAGVLSEDAEVVVDASKSNNIDSEVRKAASEHNTDTVGVKGLKGGATSTQTTSTSVFEEGKIITKQELKERRLQRMRENSEIISVKDIFGL
jgi:hypothetical protein